MPAGVEHCDGQRLEILFARRFQRDIDDGGSLRKARLRQNNLAGPAGFVSMEDGAVGGFVQRGIAAADGERAVIEMGGSGTVNEGTRATEASVRGFWKCYRSHMGI